ncbi:Transposase [Acidiphilium sp. PM]|nr:Transposase [Acidiphilium sp. PM]
MRQTHASDKKLFVDYAGDTVLVVVGRLTCETRAAQISSRFSAHRASSMPRRPQLDA